MTNEHIKNWLADFYKFLEKDNQDLIGLYHERIMFIPDADNHIHPHILPLNETIVHVTKEQVQRMNDVFADYLKTHPVLS